MTTLGADEVDRFVHHGFVRLEAAFDRGVAAACVDVLWELSGVDRNDPSTWTSPVVRVLGSAAAPLVTAINGDRLAGALDDVLGVGRWLPRAGYGSFPIRFPSAVDPGDAGWHIDGSFELSDAAPPWNLGVDVWSKRRALLLLMLFSDVGPDDAPTRVRVGSHLDMAPALARFGESGASIPDVMAALPPVEHRVVAATGQAGDVYLCHPFLVHAASWPHRGHAPRFVGQPCIFHGGGRDQFAYGLPTEESSACERAVRLAFERAGQPLPSN